MEISNQKVVSIDYTLTGPDGQVLDTSQNRGPLTYVQGGGSIIPGLERQLEHPHVRPVRLPCGERPRRQHGRSHRGGPPSPRRVPQP